MTGPSILYPALTQPVLTAAQRPEQVTESRWHQPLSQPVLRVGLSAAVVASGLFWSGFTPAPRADTWHQPLSQPILRLRVAEESPLSYAYFVPSGAEIVTVDKWLAPFGQPFPTRGPSASLVASSGESYTHFVTASIEWHQPLSRPVARANITLNYQALSYSYSIAGTATVDRWLEPLALPILRKSQIPDASLTLVPFIGASPPPPPPPPSATIPDTGRMVHMARLMARHS